MSGGVRLSEIQEPSPDATVSSLCMPFFFRFLNLITQDAELAWHFYLPGLTSGYMYYGGSQDMPVKQTVACNNAVSHANSSISK